MSYIWSYVCICSSTSMNVHHITLIREQPPNRAWQPQPRLRERQHRRRHSQSLIMQDIGSWEKGQQRRHFVRHQGSGQILILMGGTVENQRQGSQQRCEAAFLRILTPSFIISGYVWDGLSAWAACLI